jgi:hypothetical protein
MSRSSPWDRSARPPELHVELTVVGADPGRPLEGKGLLRERPLPDRLPVGQNAERLPLDLGGQLVPLAGPDRGQRAVRPAGQRPVAAVEAVPVGLLARVGLHLNVNA